VTPLAVLVHETEFVLRWHVSLIGGFAEPSGGLLVFFGDTSPFKIDVAKRILRNCVSLVRSFVYPKDVLLIVLSDALTARVQLCES